jgi:hypothetical protein
MKRTIAVAATLAAFAATPVAAQNLIPNGNFEAGDTGFTSTYLNSLPWTNAGYYTFTTDPALLCSACFPSMGDHTTGTGKMLYLDGAGSGDYFYANTVNVVPGANYVFHFYSAVLGPVYRANLAATINGSPVGSAFTPNYGSWTDFSYSFTASGSTVSIKLFDNTLGYSYNDFVVDDVQLLGPRPAGSVPEPATWAMMIGGIGVIGAVTRRRRALAFA